MKTKADAEASARSSQIEKGSSTRARWWCALLLLLTLCRGSVHAQAGAVSPGQPGGDARDDVIRQLQQRLDRLESELKDLKSARSPSLTNSQSLAGNPMAAMTPPAPAADGSDEFPDARNRYPALRFHGFGDFSYVISDREGEHNSFGLGHLDFFINSSLSENMDVLSEIVAETGDDNEVKFEVERLLLRYTPSDYLSVGVGRYHSAVGFYNTAYHHGTLFQTAVGRPFVFDFEDHGGVLPVHNVGVTANGRIPSGSLGLQYTIEVGNGRSYSDDDEPVLNLKDDNSFKSINLGLSARPEAAPGLQLGVSGYFDRLTPEALPRVNQTIVAGYVVYHRPKFEWLNEVLWLHHNPLRDAPSTDAWSAYSQIARQFGSFRPYLRYQYLRAPGSDIIYANFSETGTVHGPSIGVRYDINELATLKLQYDHYMRSEGNFRRTSVNQVTTQVGFGF